MKWFMSRSTFFLDAAFLYSCVVIFVLPIIACSVIDCSADTKGVVSVSQLLHVEPLCTVLSYFGSILLLITLNYQTAYPNPLRYVIAGLGALCLSVPLVFPIGGGEFHAYHAWFALFGLCFEVLYGVCVSIDILMCEIIRPGGQIVCWTTFVEGLCLLVGLSLYYFATGKTYIYSAVVVEYVFGATLVVQAKTLQLYGNL